MDLKIGDTVIWRGSWGNDIPKKAKVISIDINGVSVNSVNWESINNRNTIIELDNGHWCYGFQISKI